MSCSNVSCSDLVRGYGAGGKHNCFSRSRVALAGAAIAAMDLVSDYSGSCFSLSVRMRSALFSELPLIWSLIDPNGLVDISLKAVDSLSRLCKG